MFWQRSCPDGFHVWFELEFERPVRNSVDRRSIGLQRKRTRIGRDLENHVILLDPAVPARAGTIIRRGFHLSWQAHGSAEPVSCVRRWVAVGPYRLRVRISWWVIAFIVCALASTAFLTVLHGADAPTTASAHIEAISPPVPSIQLPARGQYGSLRKSERVPEASFEFDYSGEKGAEIHFAAGNVERVDQLRIEVNGVYVGFAAVSPGRWGLRESRPVRATVLKRGANRLRFVNRYPSLGDGIWGVRNISVTRLDVEKLALEDIELLVPRARRLFEQRDSQTGNLWRAEQTLRRAFEICETTQRPVPPELEDLHRGIEQAVRFMMGRGLSEARAAMSVGEQKSAEKIVHSLMAEFLDPQDARRVEVERAWDGISR